MDTPVLETGRVNTDTNNGHRRSRGLYILYELSTNKVGTPLSSGLVLRRLDQNPGSRTLEVRTNGRL